MVEVDISLNITYNIPLETVDQELMLLGEVDIGLRLSTPPTITQVVVVDCQVSHFFLVLLKKYPWR